MSNYALRIPNSLFDYAKRCAEEESVSMNQFFVMAIAEKVSALKTAEYFRERAGRANPAHAESVLRKVKARPPAKGDELPAVAVGSPKQPPTPRKRRVA
jgi:hypothetical protein